jgi:cobalt-zinc-cadmium efflux system outer membrane protein
MNLVLFALGGLCWKNIRYERRAGKIAEKIRRFGFASFVIAFLLIGVTNSGAAQSPQSGAVTVSQAVQEAIQKNVNLLAERYNVSIADALMVTARMRPNPLLSLYGNLLDLAGTGFDKQNAAGPPEYGIRIDWIIERGGKRQRRIDVAETARQVAQWRLINATRILAFDVQNAFVETLLAKETLALAREDLRSFNQIVQVNKVRVEVGDLAPVELRRTQLAALQLQNCVLQSQTKLRLAKERLQLLMGRAVPAADFDIIDEPRRDPPPVSLDEVERLALDLRPDLQALKCDQARLQAEIRLQLAQGKVDYSIGAEYRRQQGVAGRGNSLGFFFSIPLPIFNRNQGEIERAQREGWRLDARGAALEVEIRNEARNAWLQYETARALLADIENDMLKQARQVLDTMEFSYRRGEASFVEFLDARRASNETTQSYNEARAEYARSQYLIDSTIGKAPR